MQDYSNYIIAAYSFSIVLLLTFAVITFKKYQNVKKTDEK